MKKLALVLLLVLLGTALKADYLVTSRVVKIKFDPASESEFVEKVDQGTSLTLLDNGKQTNGYYQVIAPSGAEGWVYRTLVRRFKGSVTDFGSDASSSSAPPSTTSSPPSRGSSSTSTVATSSGSDGSAVSSLNFESNFPRTRNGEQLVTHEGFTSCMSTKYMLPVWVSHQISDALLKGDAKRQGSTYPQDTDFPELKANLYAKSGYDHGHLAPAGDFKRSQELTDQSFFMTNMTPQHGCMNQKGWCVLESNVRNWARLNPTSKFYLFSGPITTSFKDTLCINSLTVYVPEMFYKIVIEQTSSGRVKTAAFIVRNDDVEFADLEGGRTTIDVIESMTGLDFMPLLSPSQQTSLESRSFNYELKNLPECSGNKSCASVYGHRTTPEDRKGLKCE
ncbi:MAG TPA: DNA/RNA non-specific endonuclease [Cyclobacteriaceae bacterium]|jgi:endonuclease G|nr:DNA/RNA non-specific endonuclease [Cyclobacteriaceae bacterium]